MKPTIYTTSNTQNPLQLHSQFSTSVATRQQLNIDVNNDALNGNLYTPVQVKVKSILEYGN